MPTNITSTPARVHEQDAAGTTRPGGGARHATPSQSAAPGFKAKALVSMIALARFAQAMGADAQPMPGVQHWTGGMAAALPPMERDAQSYGGKLLPAGSPSFYKPNTHPYIGDSAVDLTPVMHPDYLQTADTRGVGKDIMAHRGLIDVTRGILENTMPAVRNAYQKGLRSVELDIQVTQDGKPVVFHDRTLGRMTDDPQNRLVNRVKWDDIKDANLVLRNPVDGNFMQTPEKMLSLEAALKEIGKTMPGMSVVLDCKGATGEAVFALLREKPELRPFVAIKPYSKQYVGGFDHFLGNLYQQHGIDPQAARDQPKRDAMLAVLKDTKLVPILSQVVLEDPQFLSQFAVKKDGPHTKDELADAAMAWLQSWDAMDVKVIEAHSMGEGTVTGQAMALVNERLAEESSGLSKAAISGSYRYEDFSAKDETGAQRYYTWGDSGEIYDKTDDVSAALRETAGTLRHEADSMLTDQPEEEAFAILQDITLPRGNTGVELALPPGARIDASRNKELANQRKAEFESDQKPFDPGMLAKVRAGRKQGAGAAEGKDDGINWVGATLGAAGAVAIVAGAAVAARRTNTPLTTFHPGRAVRLAAQKTVRAVGQGLQMARSAGNDRGTDRGNYEMV